MPVRDPDKKKSHTKDQQKLPGITALFNYAIRNLTAVAQKTIIEDIYSLIIYKEELLEMFKDDKDTFFVSNQKKNDCLIIALSGFYHKQGSNVPATETSSQFGYRTFGIETKLESNGVTIRKVDNFHLFKKALENLDFNQKHGIKGGLTAKQYQAQEVRLLNDELRRKQANTTVSVLSNFNKIQIFSGPQSLGSVDMLPPSPISNIRPESDLTPSIDNMCHKSNFPPSIDNICPESDLTPSIDNICPESDLTPSIDNICPESNFPPSPIAYQTFNLYQEAKEKYLRSDAEDNNVRKDQGGDKQEEGPERKIRKLNQ